MKSRIFILFAGLFFAAVNSLFAQHTDAPLLEKNNKAPNPFETIINTDTASAKFSLPWEVNNRALRDFEKKYKNVESVRWFKTDDGFLVRFLSNGVLTNVFYTKKGNWFVRSKQYGEDLLPKDVRHLVKSEYYDFEIETIIEVNTIDKTAYVIVMHDSTSILELSVMDGEIVVRKSFLRNK